MSTNDDVYAPDAEDALDEVEALIWGLLDERLDDAQISQLSNLLETNADLRARYIQRVQLHVDLMEHFAAQGVEKSGDVPIFPNLFPGVALPGGDSVPRVAQ